jgi:hypothetical protein
MASSRLLLVLGLLSCTSRGLIVRKVRHQRRVQRVDSAAASTVTGRLWHRSRRKAHSGIGRAQTTLRQQQQTQQKQQQRVRIRVALAGCLSFPQGKGCGYKWDPLMAKTPDKCPPGGCPNKCPPGGCAKPSAKPSAKPAPKLGAKTPPTPPALIPLAKDPYRPYFLQDSSKLTLFDYRAKVGARSCTSAYTEAPTLTRIKAACLLRAYHHICQVNTTVTTKHDLRRFHVHLHTIYQPLDRTGNGPRHQPGLVKEHCEHKRPRWGPCRKCGVGSNHRPEAGPAGGHDQVRAGTYA